ncbi:DUF3515 domain-containing protein [Pseudonocardia bannensis]|uniref:DUF3515 domain-containing protein n=1 Tax=Pseudonocardia bannensis TaxID=630973 RepID=A0A848DGT0_9PSEU|nr:DUF3515 domain-containing protein [Pseudonocardia bannensis]
MVAITLPVLLAVIVAAIGITVRIRGIDGGPDATAAAPAETGPLAVAPVDAPGAGGGECAALLAALPVGLPGDDGVLPSRPLAEPAPGVLAWAASPRPVVLRCGLPRPVELNPASALLEINGVRWLRLTDTAPDSVLATYVAVDRPVYVVLTAPSTVGSGPLQAVSDVIRSTLPATEVAVR